MLIFENVGTLDPRAFTMLGLSAKETDNPIGYFGTGLKYAIAVTLRLGGKIGVQLGDGEPIKWFTTTSATFRNVEFNPIIYDGSELSYTLAYGRNWQPWQAFRELYCNVLDESGEAYHSQEVPESARGIVRIVVSQPAIEKAFDERHLYFFDAALPNTLKTVVADIQVKRVPSPVKIFYRGILVYEGEKNSLANYNINTALTLTEDRTLSGMYFVAQCITRAWCLVTNTEWLMEYLRADTSLFEKATVDTSTLIIKYRDETNTPTAIKTAIQECYKKYPHSLPKELFDYIRNTAEKNSIVTIPLLPHEQEFVKKFTNFLATVNMSPDLLDAVHWKVQAHDQNLMGYAENGVAVITANAWTKGVHYVASTYFEEFIHARYECVDYTRAFQDHALDIAATFAAIIMHNQK